MRFSLSEEALSANQLKDNFSLANGVQQSVGAVVSFEGRVRDHNQGRKVTALEYEAYKELAEAEGAGIVAEAMVKFALLNVRCVHRIGSLNVGDLAVWISTSAAHRAEAFFACRYIIDEVKARLPVWKKEHYTDGSSLWINCQHDMHRSPALTEQEFYARQIVLPGFGQAGQNSLRKSRVLVVGAGGLGCPALLYLAGAGVGHIGVCDSDRVEPSNLHRQALFSSDQVGGLKAEIAAEEIMRQNPFISTQSYAFPITKANAIELLSGYDAVLDCTDMLETKLILSDSAIAANIALISASIYQFEGRLHRWAPGQRWQQNNGSSDLLYDGQCLRCLWGSMGNLPPPTCADSGILGASTGILGSMQALETIKYLLKMESPLSNYILIFNLLSLAVTKIAVSRNDECPLCTSVASHTTGPRLLDEKSVNKPDSVTFESVEIMVASADLSTYKLRAASTNDQEEIDGDEKYLYYCRTGASSLNKARSMRARGFTNVYSLKGGLAANPQLETQLRVTCLPNGEGRNE